MSFIAEFIESGVLELYVMEAASPDEVLEIERLSVLHPEIKAEIERIREGIEQYALAHAVAPNSTVKPLLLATIDYMQRLKSGEEATFPPDLTPESTPQDYAHWLDREDLKVPATDDDIFVKIIGFTPQVTTAIVWIKDVSEAEIHHDEHERFLILEGSCVITVDKQPHHLNPGDFFAIPLHKPHMVKVTSTQPCKAILQRAAA